MIKLLLLANVSKISELKPWKLEVGNPTPRQPFVAVVKHCEVYVCMNTELRGLTQN